MKKTDKKPEKVKLTVTVEKKAKEDFAQLCEDVGLPMGSAIAALMNQAVRKQEFKVSSLDVNGFTPKEAAEILRRWNNIKASRSRAYTTENDD